MRVMTATVVPTAMRAVTRLDGDARRGRGLPTVDALLRLRPDVVARAEREARAVVVVTLRQRVAERRALLGVRERRGALSRQEMREVLGVGPAEGEHALRREAGTTASRHSIRVQGCTDGSAGRRPPVMEFASAKAWETWLRKHHDTSDGVWLKIAKKGTGVETVTMPEVIDVALCYGWIDGLRHKHDDVYFRQRITPRKTRSRWSKINRAKAETLIAAGRMHAAGLREIDAAKADGRWDAAYAGSRDIEVPDDFTRALRRNARARRAFEQLDRTNRYAILYRIHDAKRAETRARRIEQFVDMLADGRTIHSRRDQP